MLQTGGIPKTQEKTSRNIRTPSKNPEKTPRKNRSNRSKPSVWWWFRFEPQTFAERWLRESMARQFRGLTTDLYKIYSYYRPGSIVALSFLTYKLCHFAPPPKGGEKEGEENDRASSIQLVESICPERVLRLRINQANTTGGISKPTRRGLSSLSSKSCFCAERRFRILLRCTYPVSVSPVGKPCLQ